MYTWDQQHMSSSTIMKCHISSYSCYILKYTWGSKMRKYKIGSQTQTRITESDTL